MTDKEVRDAFEKWVLSTHSCEIPERKKAWEACAVLINAKFQEREARAEKQHERIIQSWKKEENDWIASEARLRDALEKIAENSDCIVSNDETCYPMRCARKALAQPKDEGVVKP